MKGEVVVCVVLKRAGGLGVYRAMTRFANKLSVVEEVGLVGLLQRNDVIGISVQQTVTYWANKYSINGVYILEDFTYATPVKMISHLYNIDPLELMNIYHGLHEIGKRARFFRKEE